MSAPFDILRFAQLRAELLAGGASPGAQREYEALRGAFLAAWGDAPSGLLGGDGRRRGASRTRRALAVELASEAGRRSTALTFDVGPGGFSALLPEAPARGETFHATLRVAARAVDGVAVVVDARKRQRAAQVSFAIRERLGDWSPLEDLLVDDLLASAGLVPRDGSRRAG